MLGPNGAGKTTTPVFAIHRSFGFSGLDGGYHGDSGSVLEVGIAQFRQQSLQKFPFPPTFAYPQSYPQRQA